jgi:hypothetical protein
MEPTDQEGRREENDPEEVREPLDRSNPGLRHKAVTKGEITRVESEIDGLETEIDTVTQDLANKINPGALNRTSIKLALIRAAIQWILHQLTPEMFRHPSEISRLYETRKRKLARIEALKTYLKDLNEVLASIKV